MDEDEIEVKWVQKAVMLVLLGHRNKEKCFNTASASKVGQN